MATKFDENLEKKLQAVANTQDSIQSLSFWIQHHKVHHKKIANTWLKILKKSKVQHRLTLIYLANDVIQNSRKKSPQFVDSFQSVMKEAAVLSNDEKIRTSVERAFNIWEERNVYDAAFIKSLKKSLGGSKEPTDEKMKIMSEFDLKILIDNIKIIQTQEKELNFLTGTVRHFKTDLTTTSLVQKFKDKSHGLKYSQDYDEKSLKLEEVLQQSEKLKEMRIKLFEIIEKAKIYYNLQKGEVKLVTNAYKNFSSRIVQQNNKLQKIIGSFSPIPSPPSEAPSPTNSDDGPFLDPTILPKESLVTSKIQKVSSPIKTNCSPPTKTDDSFTPSQIDDVPSSWMGSFLSSSSNQSFFPVTGISNNSSSSSLESRLSNFINNIAPSSNPFTKDIKITPNASNSPNLIKVEASTIPDLGSMTPLKDEGNGRETPVQDEEIPLPPPMTSFLGTIPLGIINDPLSTLTALITQPPPGPPTSIPDESPSISKLLEKVAYISKGKVSAWNQSTNNITVITNDSSNCQTVCSSSFKTNIQSHSNRSLDNTETLDMEVENSLEVPLEVKEVPQTSNLVTLTAGEMVSSESTNIDNWKDNCKTLENYFTGTSDIDYRRIQNGGQNIPIPSASTQSWSRNIWDSTWQEGAMQSISYSQNQCNSMGPNDSTSQWPSFSPINSNIQSKSFHSEANWQSGYLPDTPISNNIYNNGPRMENQFPRNQNSYRTKWRGDNSKSRPPQNHSKSFRPHWSFQPKY